MNVSLSERSLIFADITLVEGVKERLEFEESSGRPQKTASQPLHLPPSSRRRKGTFTHYEKLQVIH